MDNLDHFQAGVNLGGWLSQYSHFDHGHFQTFITAADIQRISVWGLDHVRLPVDYPVLIEDDLKTLKDSGFKYLDNCLDWCVKAGLGVVLDMHHAPGYTFDKRSGNTLFQNRQAQEGFLYLWETLAKRYAGLTNPPLIFELLNEVVLPSSHPWNDLAAETVQRIRSVDKDHWVMVGGNYYNSITALKDLAIIPDGRIVYTFHFYEPLPFTHQKAYWVDWLNAFDRTFDYPSRVTGLGEFLTRHPEYKEDHRASTYVNLMMDQAFLLTLFQQAVDFQAAHHVPLYCGEYGAIEQAPLEGKVRWNQDLVSLLNQNHIGRAYWSYKAMDFGLVDKDGNLVSDQLLRAVCQRV
jgi:endoglucanase